jgi:hypothetical protein
MGVFLWMGTVTAAQEIGGLRASPIQPAQTLEGVKSQAGLVSVIVKFDAEPVAKYRGGVQGLAPTSPQVTGAPIRRSTPSVQAYESFLAAKESQFGAALQRQVPRGRIVHRLRMVVGGVSVIVPRDQVAELARLPGVQALYPDVPLPLDTDRSPEFIGAPDLWEDLGGKGHAGEGVVVGILDSGIWPESPSVQDDGSYPPPPAGWTGTACEIGSAHPDDPPFSCDNKLIGARRVMSTFDMFGPAPLPGEFFSARDNNGHGSHTATTAAGNAGVAAEFQGAPLGVISGVAPRAHLAVYKVCFTRAETGQGSCYASDSAAAVQQAIIDGVDVLNFSVGGGTNPYADAVSLAFLDAYAAGVFVACSAGNSGPGLDTVGHREPWTTTVAATTTDKLYAGSASLSDTGGASLDVTGASSYEGMVPPAPVVLASQAPSYEDGLCLDPAAPGTFDGRIVVCERGEIARVAKSANVAAGGAVGMIFYNPAPDMSLNADIHSVPTVHIDSTQGEALVDFLMTASEPYASITGMRSLEGQGDVLADFSSRGGPGQTLGISKPDVAAPGVDILAGVSGKLAVPVGPDGQLWDIYSGTSMSSPHVAGAAALLKQLHPDWGPGEIKSALMMTATDAVLKEDGATPATPFEVGSGRIDLTRAGDAGLLISETAENFVAYQSNLSLANLPSLYLPVMPGKVAVPRTIVNALERRHRCDKWKVSVEAPPDVEIKVPSRLKFGRDGSRDIWISVDASRVPLGEVRHARLVFEHRWDHGRRPFWKHHPRRESDVLAFPVTLVKQQGGATLVKTCDETELSLWDATHCTIAAANTTFEPAEVVVTDVLPGELYLAGVTGADRVGWRRLRFEGSLPPAEPPDVTVGPGTSPAGGYLPLSGFGIAPVDGLGDETIVNFNVDPFLFAGQVYNRIAAVSNGYAVIGGGTTSDVDFVNQDLPDPAAPNHVLAPFWTDLDFNKGGQLRAGYLTDGVSDWLILDWENVHVYTADDPVVNSFQIWIQVGGEVEDITFAYGEVGVGDGGFLTVGAENQFGNRGGNYYFNGVGTPPTEGAGIAVSGTPGAPGEAHEIDYSAWAWWPGQWFDCAEMDSELAFGTTTACVEGTVSRWPWWWWW